MASALPLCLPVGLAVLAGGLSGCSAGGGRGGADAGAGWGAGGGMAPATIALADVSGDSPDLADSPYGGQDGWDASDKYGPGVALVDLDGDGVLDLVQPRNDRADPSKRSLRMYRGLGDGTFQAVTPPAWDTGVNALAVLAFDFDGDDDLDLFVCVDGGPSVLYRNDGDFSFTDVAAEAGVALRGVRAFAAAAADIDGDGDLDLYVGTWNASAEDHGPGTAPNVLFENQGDGSFRDVTDAAGVACEGRSTLGLAFADLDGDGDQDLMVANDFFPACLYQNLGGGRFAEVAADAGVRGGAMNGMGVAVGDLDGDGRLDVIVTDDQVPDDSIGNAVYLNRTADGGAGGLHFDSRAVAMGLDGVDSLGLDWAVYWGVGIADFDLDGRPDVHMASHGGRPELVWQGQEDGGFALARGASGDLVDVDGRGSAYGDIDGDGDLDMVVARRGAGLEVIRNDTGGDGAWLTIEPRPLARAPGARVAVTVGGATQIAEVQAGSSYQSSGPPSVTVGLGRAARADRVEVRFSDGQVVELDDVGLDQHLVVDHP